MTVLCINLKLYIFLFVADVFLGLQVRYMKNQFEKKIESIGIEVAVSDMKDYGMIDGEKVLNTTISIIK